MRTVKAWIVDVYRNVYDYQDGPDIAWTEIYETEEEALAAVETHKREYLFHYYDIYEDEVDVWDDDIFEKEDEDANELIPVARCVGSP